MNIQRIPKARVMPSPNINEQIHRIQRWSVFSERTSTQTNAKGRVLRIENESTTVTNGAVFSLTPPCLILGHDFCQCECRVRARRPGKTLGVINCYDLSITSRISRQRASKVRQESNLWDRGRMMRPQALNRFAGKFY